MASVPEDISDALAAQISTQLCGTANPVIPNLQVVAIGPFPVPTAPSIDIFPSSEFQLPMAFGRGNNEYYFDVRARVGTPDDEAAKRLLLSMMASTGTTSMAQAILSDLTLGGTVQARIASVTGPSGYGTFDDGNQDGRRLVGCIWTVRVVT